MIYQIAANPQTSMVELKTGLSLYTVELGNPVGAPMLILSLIHISEPTRPS